MSINLSNFRQEVSKVRLSEVAFGELLSVKATFESDTQKNRFDTKSACIDPLHAQVLIYVDNKFLHTRTHFIDMNAPRAEIDDAELLNDLNRYMLRMWLRKQ